MVPVLIGGLIDLTSFCDFKVSSWKLNGSILLSVTIPTLSRDT